MEMYLKFYAETLGFPTENVRREVNLLITEDGSVAIIDERSEKSFKDGRFAYTSDFTENLKACNADRVLIINADNPKEALCLLVEEFERAEQVFDEFGEEILIINLKNNKL